MKIADSQPDPDDELPPQMMDDLRSLYTPYPSVPRPVDGNIRFVIHGHFTNEFPRRRMWRKIGRWAGGVVATGAALAALIALVITLIPHGPRGGNVASNVPVAVRSTDKLDLNGDGRVDVLDAFMLARQIKAGGKLDARFDVNGDGVVDQRDVSAIASAAVSLQRRPLQ